MADKDKIVYTSETPVKDILEEIKRLSACSEAIAWDSRYTNKTIGELIDGVSDGTHKESWLIWALVKLGGLFDSPTRKRYIDKITDPMIAFNLYCRLDWLTDKEGKLLEAKFKGKLPTAEAELAQGIVKRKKS